MRPDRRRALLILLVAGVVTLVVAPAALASAGGGSTGFSGGGGGGGHGNGFALYIIIDLLIHIAVLGHGLGAIVLVGLALGWFLLTRGGPIVADRWHTRAARGQRNRPSSPRRRSSGRERRVELAAAEASESDPAYSADQVRVAAATLFTDIQDAWDADDRIRLRSLVAPDLLIEWERRLDDFERRGWRNRVQPLGEPGIELVGLQHTGDDDSDHVVVRVEARLKDYVVDRRGRHLKRTGRLGETTRIREFWTLGRRGSHPPHWVLVSIEQAREGAHSLDEQVVATPWSDERALRDAALIEGAVADAVPSTTSVAEIASVSYSDDAHAAAMDLSVADGRFSPDVLEVAARRAVEAWARAIDGSDRALDAIATPEAKRELLYVGDMPVGAYPDGHTPADGALRVVVRGPVVNRIRVVALDAAALPPSMTLEVDLSGRRYVENRDTTAVVSGSRTRRTSFTERWTLSLCGDEREPWRVTAAGAPVGQR